MGYCHRRIGIIFIFFTGHFVLFCVSSYTPCRDASECEALPFYYCDTGLEVCVHCSRMCSHARVSTSKSKAERCEKECSDYMQQQRLTTTTPSTTKKTVVYLSKQLNLKELKDISSERSEPRFPFAAVNTGLLAAILLVLLVGGLMALLCRRKDTQTECKCRAQHGFEGERAPLMDEKNCRNNVVVVKTVNEHIGGDVPEVPPPYRTDSSGELQEDESGYPLTAEGARQALNDTVPRYGNLDVSSVSMNGTRPKTGSRGLSRSVSEHEMERPSNAELVTNIGPTPFPNSNMLKTNNFVA